MSTRDDPKEKLDALATHELAHKAEGISRFTSDSTPASTRGQRYSLPNPDG
ncbi:MAG: hypothetical protein FWD79_07680 [Desulfobulbus sp.]|nr:hypothetical protein [Desulfobulbus sp.]